MRISLVLTCLQWVWYRVCLFWTWKYEVVQHPKKESPLIRAHKHFPKSPDSSSDAVANAGEKKVTVNVYGGEDGTINTLRLTSFVESAATSNIKISHLPPPKRGCKIPIAQDIPPSDQKSLGVDKTPIDWRWATNEQGLITMFANPAPHSNFCEWCLASVRKQGTHRIMHLQKSGAHL